ncbi:hypothetical protein GGI16_002412 [Coemansia sp. S142-1]|nr:hypothetical protein GGI16_002412 [Coemansia sp. S142-1]
MDEATNGAGSGPEVPILGQIYQRLNTMDGNLVIIISLDQETVAPNTDPVANAHLATLSTASGSTVVTQGSSLTLHSRPASAATRPSTHIHPQPPSAASSSAGVARSASPAMGMRLSAAATPVAVGNVVLQLLPTHLVSLPLLRKLFQLHT